MPPLLWAAPYNERYGPVPFYPALLIVPIKSFVGTASLRRPSGRRLPEVTPEIITGPDGRGPVTVEGGAVRVSIGRGRKTRRDRARPGAEFATRIATATHQAGVAAVLVAPLAEAVAVEVAPVPRRPRPMVIVAPPRDIRAKPVRVPRPPRAPVAIIGVLGTATAPPVPRVLAGA